MTLWACQVVAKTAEPVPIFPHLPVLEYYPILIDYFVFERKNSSTEINKTKRISKQIQASYETAVRVMVLFDIVQTIIEKHNSNTQDLKR